MTFGRFVIKNSFRNKRRTLLTILSIGFSLCLLILMHTFMDFFTNPPSAEHASLRLVVQRSTAFIDQMPISYFARLEKVPHVTLVVPVQIFGGYYKDPKNVFPSLATDPRTVWDMFPEQHITPEDRKAFETERTGAIVGQKLLDRFGWKVGDRITLIGQLAPVDLDFKIVGSYEGEISAQNDVFYFRGDYLSEAMGNPGTVGLYWLRAASAEAIPGIKETVDSMFRNSPAETRTETEKSFILGFFGMLGNIKLLMSSISIVVVFTMLLVAASTMAMTIRERYREIAILKSMGYPSRTVLSLILSESVFIALLGAVVGCGLSAVVLTRIYAFSNGMIPISSVELVTYGLAVAMGAGIGVLSAILPALQASRMTITSALRLLG